MSLISSHHLLGGAYAQFMECLISIIMSFDGLLLLKVKSCSNCYYHAGFYVILNKCMSLFSRSGHTVCPGANVIALVSTQHLHQLCGQKISAIT